jgi:molecular chaperone DnaK
MEYVLGIDLGTTNTCVYYTKEDKSLEIIPIDNKSLLPSVVSFRDSSILIGQNALNQLIINPQNTIYAFKRLIGRRWESSFLQNAVKSYTYKIIKHNESSVRVEVDDKLYSIEEISALVLSKIRKEASKKLGVDVTKAVITVPAYFNENQRKTTKDAGVIAGLDVVSIINEPTAAALAYGIKENSRDQHLLIYDLGGGTFDVTVLDIMDNIFEVVATVGDTFLGGEDFTNKIVSWIEGDIINRYDSDFDLDNDPIIHQRIKNAAEILKKDLSKRNSSVIELPFLFVTKEKTTINYNVEITLELFNELVEPLVDKTIDLINQMLDYTNLEISNIDKIILVGGQTRSRIVTEKLEALFERKISKSINPDEAVAIGAAIKGRLLFNNEDDSLLLDVISQSMGIMVSGGFYEKIIDKDSVIPCSSVKTFTTIKDNQDQVDINIFQGEYLSASENTYLGTIKIKDIPLLPQGEFKIDVTFLVDSEGILTVEATEIDSEKTYKLILEGTSGLTANELEKLAENSNLINNFELDKTELYSLLKSIKKLIPSATKVLKEDEENLLKLSNYKKYIKIIEEKEHFNHSELANFTENLIMIESALKTIINA